MAFGVPDSAWSSGGNSASNPFTLDYAQFQKAMQPYAAGNNRAYHWASPEGQNGSVALTLANGKTWTPSGANSGVRFVPKGTVLNPQVTNQGSGADRIGLPYTPKYSTEDTWQISGDMSSLLGKSDTNAHKTIDYVLQDGKLVPKNVQDWQYENNGLGGFIKDVVTNPAFAAFGGIAGAGMLSGLGGSSSAAAGAGLGDAATSAAWGNGAGLGMDTVGAVGGGYGAMSSPVLAGSVEASMLPALSGGGGAGLTAAGGSGLGTGLTAGADYSLGSGLTAGGAGAASGGLGTGLTAGAGAGGLGLAGTGLGGGMSSWIPGISNDTALMLGANALSGVLGYKASGDAASAQADAAARSADLQYKMFQESNALQEPWRKAGADALNKLIPLASNYQKFGMDQFQADPGYQFRLSEGLKGLDRQAAARGGLISGAALKAATRYGQDMGSQEYGNAFNRYQTERSAQLNPLQSLAGVGQTAATQMGNTGTTMATNVGNAYESGANARASGYVGQVNALNSALGNGLNYYQNQQIINRMRGADWTGG